MKKYLRIKISKNHQDIELQDRKAWKKMSPEARLDAVEGYRLEAGKFLYAYPSRLRRIVRVTRTEPC